jgi:SHS2 domain-containing protein
MGYAYLDHISDIGIKASGESMEEAFKCGAEAVLNIFFDTEAISDEISITIKAKAPSPSIDLLFIESLNELISIQDRESLALKGIRDVEIKEGPEGLSFTASAYGESFRPDKHKVKCEVKGATYSGLSYEVTNGIHTFTCVVDV